MSIDKNNYNWMIEKHKQSLEDKYIAKIPWGNRSIHRYDWVILKKFFSDNNIKTIIEYGVGLSTELMLLEGLEVTSLETLDWWAEHCKKTIGNKIITYKERLLPSVGEARYDLAFVDGPQGGRAETIAHAREHSDLVYLHDLRPAEVALMSDWFVIDIGDYEGHFFSKERKTG